MSKTLTGAVPILRVNNLDASLDYYITRLGFKKNWQWPRFASVGRDEVTIFLCEGGQGQPGTWMSIFTKDAVSLYEEYKATGARIVEPPMNFPWGHCEFLVTDLDGHMLRMSGDKTGPDSDGYERTLRATPT